VQPEILVPSAGPDAPAVPEVPALPEVPARTAVVAGEVVAIPEPAGPSPAPDAVAPPGASRPTPGSGAELRAERERLHLALETIAEKTKIRPNHLLALEEERFGDLPAVVFVRGFLREYARCLALPGDEVCNLYMKRYRDWHESRGLPGGASGGRTGA